MVGYYTSRYCNLRAFAFILKARLARNFELNLVRLVHKQYWLMISIRTGKGRILICAQSNAAVDELVSRLREGTFGCDGKVYTPYIVRVGNAKTVHPDSMPFYIDTLIEEKIAENQNHAKMDLTEESSSSLRARLEKLVDTIRYYESKRAKSKDGDVNMNNSDDGIIKESVQEKSDAEIGAKLNILYAQKKDICRDLSVAQLREKKISEESWTLKQNIRKSILREAEIVLTTLSGCGGDLYGVCSGSDSNNRFGSSSEQTLFDAVIIDEAAQALEPATLIPLQLSSQIKWFQMLGIQSSFLLPCFLMWPANFSMNAVCFSAYNELVTL